MFSIDLPGSVQETPHTSTFTFSSPTFRVTILAVSSYTCRLSIPADCIIAPGSIWVRRLRRGCETRTGRETGVREGFVMTCDQSHRLEARTEDAVAGEAKHFLLLWRGDRNKDNRTEKPNCLAVLAVFQNPRREMDLFYTSG